MSDLTSKKLPLQGRAAIVTGGSRGIGRAACRRLARDGASVVVNYANSSKDAEGLVAEISKAGGRAVAVQADVSKPAACVDLVKQTVKHFGRVDIVVHNAGVLLYKTLDQVTEELFDQTFNLNVKGPLFLTQAALPHMKEGGRIIFVSSTVTTSSNTMPSYLLYNASKGAVDQINRVLVKEAARHGVIVNTVSPGPTDTELFRQGKTEDQIKMMAGQSPFNRLGQPDDIANVIAFLAGEECGWVVGQNIRANGGYVV